MAQPVYGPPVSSQNGMPPPPGIEPVTLPQSTENGESMDAEVKVEGSEETEDVDRFVIASVNVGYIPCKQLGCSQKAHVQCNLDNRRIIFHIFLYNHIL